MRFSLIFFLLLPFSAAQTVDDTVYMEWAECARLCLNHEIHQTEVYVDCLMTCGHFALDLNAWRPCLSVLASDQTKYEVQSGMVSQIMKHKNLLQRMNTWEAQKVETKTYVVLQAVGSFKEKLQFVYDGMQEIIAATSPEEEEVWLERIQEPLQNASQITDPLTDDVADIAFDMRNLEYKMENTFELFSAIIHRRSVLLDMYKHIEKLIEDLYDSLMAGVPLVTCPRFLGDNNTDVEDWAPLSLYLPPLLPDGPDGPLCPQCPSVPQCPTCPSCPTCSVTCPTCPTCVFQTTEISKELHDSNLERIQQAIQSPEGMIIVTLSVLLCVCSTFMCICCIRMMAYINPGRRRRRDYENCAVDGSRGNGDSDKWKDAP